MKIRVGFEMLYDLPQPTPMIMVLGTHFTRASMSSCRTSSPPTPSSRSLPIATCLAIGVAVWSRPPAACGCPPMASFATADCRIRYSLRGPACGRGSSGGHPSLSARQPLLRDRSTFGDRLAIIPEHGAGLGACASDLRFRPPSHRFRIRARSRQQDGMGSL